MQRHTAYNAAGAVEDSGDALLRPVATGKLLLGQVVDAATHRLHVGRSRCHQCEQCPRGVDHAAAAIAPARHALFGVGLVVARREVFAPATVGVLRREQESARAAQRVRLGRLPCHRNVTAT